MMAGGKQEATDTFARLQQHNFVQEKKRVDWLAGAGHGRQDVPKQN
jgi:hypothetical protein